MEKFSFPTLSQQATIAWLTKLIGLYEKNQSRPNKEILNDMGNKFDITKIDGACLCREDKELNHKQVELDGKVGYTTHKPASNSFVHPSKRQRHLLVSHEQIASTSSIESEPGTSSGNMSRAIEGCSDDDLEPAMRKKPSATY